MSNACLAVYSDDFVSIFIIGCIFFRFGFRKLPIILQNVHINYNYSKHNT